MKPVDQTIFGGQEGNCFAACIASIFDLSIEAVPNFCAHGDQWMVLCCAWAKERGFAAVRLMLTQDEHVSLERAREHQEDWMPDALAIVSGNAERGHLHATVWRGGEMIHDPHPSRAGLLDVLDVIVFVPHQPRLT